MTPITVAALIQALLAGGPVLIDFFIKIESLLNLTPDDKQNIANAIAAANTTDQDTINKVGAWMAAHGFVAQVKFIPKVTP